MPETEPVAALLAEQSEIDSGRPKQIAVKVGEIEVTVKDKEQPPILAQPKLPPGLLPRKLERLINEVETGDDVSETEVLKSGVAMGEEKEVAEILDESVGADKSEEVVENELVDLVETAIKEAKVIEEQRMVNRVEKETEIIEKAAKSLEDILLHIHYKTCSRCEVWDYFKFRL